MKPKPSNEKLMTHSACEEALKLWKGDAPCCSCVPHRKCKLMQSESEPTETMTGVRLSATIPIAQTMDCFRLGFYLTNLKNEHIT